MAFFVFAHIYGSVRKRNLNISFIEGQFDPAVEFSADTPLLDGLRRRSDYGPDGTGWTPACTLFSALVRLHLLRRRELCVPLCEPAGRGIFFPGIRNHLFSSSLSFLLNL